MHMNWHFLLTILGIFSHGGTNISLRTAPGLGLTWSIHIEAIDLLEMYRGYLDVSFFSSLGEAYVKGNRSNDAVCGESEKDI